MSDNEDKGAGIDMPPALRLYIASWAALGAAIGGVAVGLVIALALVLL